MEREDLLLSKELCLSLGCYYCTRVTLREENISLELPYRFRCLVYCRHTGRHGSREGTEGSASESAGSGKRQCHSRPGESI